MPVTKSSSRRSSARVGLYLAGGGTALLIILALLAVFTIPIGFGPFIMCGTGPYIIPFSLGAIFMGIKGYKDNVKEALIAIIIGLSLPVAVAILSWVIAEISERCNC